MLQIEADRYLPVDDALIPLPDAPAPVAGTRFRFSRRRLEIRLDHCWCLADGHGPLRQVASLTADLRLRVLTAPGLQVYDGGHFPQTGLAGHPGQTARPQSAVAFEAQEY